MKKIVMIVFLLLIFGNIVAAQVIDDSFVDDLEENKKEVEGKIDDFKQAQENQTESEYLKREWRALLEKGKYGGVIFKASDFVEKVFGPLFKVVLGVEYSLSWAFIFAVIVWLTFFLFMADPAQAILNRTWIGLVVAFILTSLIGMAGVIRKAVDVMSALVSNIWIAWISLIITIIIAFVIIRLGGGLKTMIDAQKEKSEKLKAKRNRKVLNIAAKSAKEQLKG